MSSAFCGRIPDSPPDPSRIRPGAPALRSVRSLFPGGLPERASTADSRIGGFGGASEHPAAGSHGADRSVKCVLLMNRGPRLRRAQARHWIRLLNEYASRPWRGGRP